MCCGLALQVSGEEVVEAVSPGGKCPSSQVTESTDRTETKGDFQISPPVTSHASTASEGKFVVQMSSTLSHL